MSTRILAVFAVLFVVSTARAEVFVELVPDRSGPYLAGSSVHVDFWLRSEVAFDAEIGLIQFDFSVTNPALGLAPSFVFDYSSIEDASNYEDRYPSLPVPWTRNYILCVCPQAFLPLPAGGSLHVGELTVQLPIELGTYRLDALNASFPTPEVGVAGGIIGFRYNDWKASTGEATGGTLDFIVSVPIPTVSGWGTLILSVLLISFGIGVIVRRLGATPEGNRKGDRIKDAGMDSKTSRATGRILKARRIASTLSALILPSLLNSTLVTAQETPLLQMSASTTVPLSSDSGIVGASGQGTEPVLLFSDVIEVSGAPWIQVLFAEVQLSGSVTSGTASFIRLSSLDGAVQSLDSAAVTQWGNRSAYFNGDSVILELFAFRNTGSNRVRIEEVLAGVEDDPEVPPSICGPTDDRIPSNDPRSARTYGSAICSAFLFNDRPNCLLTAGHCCALFYYGVGVEFNVPWSTPSGAIRHPGPEDQYPVDRASVRYRNGGIGNDWCVFSVFDNTTTGLSPLEAQGASYQLAENVPPPNGSTVGVTGYGADLTPPEFNHTQQTHAGPYNAGGGTTVRFVVDVMPGNSGSAVEHLSSELVYGIVTHSGCFLFSGIATRIDRPDLQGAIPCALCGDNNDCNSNGNSDECDIASGTSLDCNNNGVPDECESSLGACCVDDTCTVVRQTCCDSQGGAFAGPGTTCEPVGACCVGGACAVRAQSCCNGTGAFGGAGTYCEDCNGNGVPAPCEWKWTREYGACCNGEGACIIATECSCPSSFLGVGTACGTLECPYLRP